MSAMKLYHVSEDPSILRFDPRPAPASSNLKGDLVWAVDEEHLPNYLLPRNCPRVCFARRKGTTETDVARFLEHSEAHRVITVERQWVDRIRETKLFIYTLPPVSFECVDAGAGYYVSREAVAFVECTELSDLPHAIKDRGAELRIMDNLWPLHDAVAASTLEFSMIRMRHATSRN